MFYSNEYNLKNFNAFNKENGIVKQITILYTLEQNSVAKRKNGTFVESVQCMLQQMKLDHKFWEKVKAIVAYI